MKASRSWRVEQSRAAKKQTYLLDNRQDPRLRGIISVGADAQVDLLGRSVLAVLCHQPKKRVFRSLRNGIREEDRSFTSHDV